MNHVERTDRLRSVTICQAVVTFTSLAIAVQSIALVIVMRNQISIIREAFEDLTR